MGLACSCPAGTSLETIPTYDCPENFGQIQKVAFQRLKQTDGSKNSFVGTGSSSNPIGTLASWTAAESASDASKIVISPFIQAPATDGGDAITFGGGNDTLGGVSVVLGSNPVNFTSLIREAPQNVIAALKKLMCESKAENLGVYLFNEAGQIAALQDSTTATTYYPIPIRTLFVGDKMLGGLETPDSNALNWSFKPNWSDSVALVTPSFDPLTDL